MTGTASSGRTTENGPHGTALGVTDDAVRDTTGATGTTGGGAQGTRAAGQPAPPGSEAAPRGGARRIVAVFVVMLAVAMDLIDTSAVNVALPSIRGGLGMGDTGLKWVVAGYSLAFAMLLITGGRLGDVIGYKRAFMTGTGIFLAASLACALAPGAGVLVAARIVQGGAAALMVPQATSLLQLMYRPQERAKVMGLFGALAGLAAALGPLVGGALLKADLPGQDWRPLFLLNVPIGAAALIAGALLLPSGGSPEPTRIDPRGNILAAIGLGLLVLPLIQGPDDHWPAWTFVSLIASVPVLVLLVRDQRVRGGRGATTLVDPSLFRQRSFVSGLALSLLVEAVMGGLTLATTLTLQEGLGRSALAAGLTTLPMIVGMVLGVAALADPLIPRLGRHVVTIGCTGLALGVLTTAWVLHHYGHATHTWQLVPGLVVTGVGLGMSMGPLFAITLQNVPAARAGSASGVLESVEQLGAVLGVVSIGGIYLHRAATHSFVAAYTFGAGAILVVLLLAILAGPALPRHFRSEEELEAAD
ncbi:drug resistance transporter, EmrB/QacA subfamily [Actinacidiphila yanglinensis]|uniref:Drug resistance transporter, EmrB/QacA subfamily n=1 Tax=Actinacidiphila yanglinensis TaxID=310779 RepID=A0A1H6DVP5_9ACTN|nr:MFS transporter [Actinacidiphila yanglinensis]SEG89350.1 drug resistance transporter, EmrB/QacA subfamily [Actinacidiphila yanglinensis]